MKEQLIYFIEKLMLELSTEELYEIYVYLSKTYLKDKKHNS